MRRVALALGLLLALATTSFAQLASPLELVRGLRQHGLVDLAVQRLEELKANPALISPDEAKLIPLELARIRLEEASRESEDARRATLIGQAKASFDEFIRENPTHPMAAQANVEIARLLALQAKGQLSRGNRQEDKEARALEFSRARPDFTNAINRYKSAILNLDTRLKKLEEKDPLAAELKRSKAQAELDAAVLQYELGLTFVGEDELKNRGEAVEKAQKEFEALATTYANQRIGYLAQVWALQCGFINGDPKAVSSIEKFATANRPNRDAADAVRLAGYFGIEHAFAGEAGKETTGGNQFQRAEQAAARWLQAYPDAKNTPEGLGARFRRALMKEYQATRVAGMIQYKEPPKATAKPKEGEPEAPKGRPKITSVSQSARLLLEEANKIYQELTETDNEYSERAHRHRLSNQLILLESDGRGGDPPLKSVNTLEQAYLAAQVQQAKIFELQKDNRAAADVEKEEKQRVKRAIEYLERGLQRVAPKDTPREVFDAQLLLTQFLTKDDRATEAAVLGEALARNNPKLSKASAAAVLGIYAYNTAIGRLKQAGGRDDDESVDLQHLKNLATYAISTWPNDGPTDAARHVLGFYLENKDRDYETAWRTYAGIGSGYPAVAQARREMAGALFYLLRPEEKDPKKYREALQANLTSRAKQYQATIAALDALPPPPPSAPGHAVESWAGAKTMQAQLYYMAADYDKVDQTVKLVTNTLAKLPDPDEKHREALDPKKRQDLAYTIRALKFNALQGRAAEFIRAKEFAKVGEVLGPEVEALKKELKEPPPAEETPGYPRLRKARQDFAVVAMSGYLQNKQPDQAGELLDALQSAGGSVEQNAAAMRQLAASVRGQIEALTKEGKKAEADEMGRGFTEFLDKVKGDDTSKLSKNTIIFLGEGYAAVDQHAKAADLFGQLLAKTDPHKAQGDYRQLEFLRARALRQAGKFPEATALMRKIVGDPVPAKKGEAPPPRGWGYGNIAIRKEYCLLLEDQNFFGPAVQNWTQMTADFAQSRGGPPLPVKFLGSRPVFETYGKALDGNLTAHFGMPTDIAAFLDTGFKTVFPTVAEKRNQQRLVYFDLYYEAMRCSARAYTTPAIVAKLKGGQATAEQKLADIGQKFHELLTKNDDVPPDVREKITELINKHPQMKKKFDELTAAAPAPKTN